MNVDNAKQKEIRERNLFLGMAPINVLSVNPNKEELSALLGIDIDNEPIYETQDGKSVIVKFWGKPEGYETFVPVTFYLEKEPQVSANTGKFNFINKNLVESWANSEEEIAERLKTNEEMQKWYSLEGLRKMHKGENKLYSFIYTMWNIDTTQCKVEDITFSNFNGLLNGDFTELKSLMANLIKTGNNKVKVLCGVKQGETRMDQVVYTSVFANIRQNKFTRLEKEANGEYGFKGDYGNDLTFRVYDEKTFASSSTPEVEENNVF